MPYSEILVDHTSVHVFRPGQDLSGQELRFRTRELLQFIEAFLLSDVMWLCDTVTGTTMSISQSIIDKFAEHGLTNPRSDGKFRLTRFTESQIRSCCAECAAVTYEALICLSEGSFSGGSQSVNYSVRPDGAQPLTFPDIAKIPFGGAQSQDFIAESIQSRGWGPMAAIPLLNPDLYQWLIGFSARFPDPDHPAHERLNTILRWKFNEILAVRLSDSGRTKFDVNYAPALGRAITVKELSLRQWRAEYIRIEEALQDTGPKYAGEEMRTFLSDIQPNRTLPLPLLGIWVLSGLKEECTIDDLFAALAEANADSNVIALRRWLSTADEDSVTQTAHSVARNLPKIIQKSQRGKSRVVETLQHEFILPLLIMSFKVIHKVDLATSTATEKANYIRSLLPKPRARTIVSGLVSDVFLSGLDEAGLSKRTESILRSMKHVKL